VHRCRCVPIIQRPSQGESQAGERGGEDTTCKNRSSNATSPYADRNRGADSLSRGLPGASARRSRSGPLALRHAFVESLPTMPCGHRPRCAPTDCGAVRTGHADRFGPAGMDEGLGSACGPAAASDLSGSWSARRGLHDQGRHGSRRADQACRSRRPLSHGTDRLRPAGLQLLPATGQRSARCLVPTPAGRCRRAGRRSIDSRSLVAFRAMTV